MKKEYTEEMVQLIIEGAIQEEREACALMCENMSGPIEIYNPAYVHYIGCAKAIRARGQDEPTIDGWPLYSGLPQPKE
jgi:hypothetical protein